MTSATLPEKLNRINVLLLLLYAPDSTGRANAPIRGRTRLQKLTFLVQQELKKRQTKGIYSFRPFKLGPYSTEIYRDVAWLQLENVILEHIESLSDGTNYSSFNLSAKGLDEVMKLLRNDQWVLVYNIVSEIKKHFGNMDLEKLVDRVHREYPDYKSGSWF
jgi:uncharacterized protein YwgA